MIRYDNDLRFVKAVGLAIAAIGAILLILSIAIGILSVLRVTPTGFDTFTFATIAQGILALVMSFSMVACGAELAHPDPLLASGRETLRLNWAALFGFMTVTWLVGFWLIPALGVLSLVIMLLLVTIRAAVIRIS